MAYGGSRRKQFDFTREWKESLKDYNDAYFDVEDAKNVGWRSHKKPKNTKVKAVVKSVVVIPKRPALGFKKAGLGERLRKNIRAAGFDQPFPMQQYLIPYIKSGSDVIGHSFAGSGKTVAYILPIVDALYKKKNEPVSRSERKEQAVRPHALVLVPTRESAVQVADEFERLSNGLPVNTMLIYDADMYTRRDGDCDIVVTTPGQLQYFIDRGNISLVQVKYFVLDKADQMLAMGLGPDIQLIVESGMPSRDTRQTLLFSVTFPSEVEKLCEKYMKKNGIIISSESTRESND